MPNFYQLNSAFAVVSVLGLAAIVASIAPAQAAQIQYSSLGNVRGINGLLVNGISYEVSFQFDTFTNVFGTPNSPNFNQPTFWRNHQAAQIAADSIVSLLNSQQSVPSRVNSISSVYIPYEAVFAPSNGSTYITSKIGNFISRWDSYRGNSRDIQELANTKVNYALFTATVAQTPVYTPEPTTLLGLLGTVGFLSIGYWRKQIFTQN